ncbi:MAG: hypothetical protein PHX18_00430 [Candidatus Gastranaerophilales bacterium]|nr:hypothetical protein [Candidatus Gastranaerophilales bacterium]
MKRFLTLILTLCAISFAQVSFAQEDLTFSINDVRKQEITKVINEIETYSNAKNQKALSKLYSEDYANDDGFNKEELLVVIKKTYDAYNDLKFEIKIDDIIVNNNYAAVVLTEKITGKTKQNSEIITEQGHLNVYIKEVIYLKKINASWAVYYEDVLIEKSGLAYGAAKKICADITAPLKVASDSDYTASLIIDIPSNTAALASINNEPITPDLKTGKEIFRQVPLNNSVLERVMKANKKGQNEMVIASVGLTQLVEEASSKQTKIKLGGLLILMEKVDVFCPAKQDEIKK